MFSKMGIAGRIFVFAIMLNFVCGEYYDECDGVEPETFVASSQSCADYIYCDGEDSILDTCDEGQYFDGQMCDAKENVQCDLDVDDNEEEPEEEDEEEEVEEGEEEVEAGGEEEAAGGSEVGAGGAEVGAGGTEVGAGGEGSVGFLDVPPIVKDTCPLVDDPNQIILIANSNSCSDYYVCYHGHAISMHCMDHLHFNTATGKCDFPENANCKLSAQAPSEIRKCLPNMSEFFPHPSKCNYFYYCIKGYQTLQQCPFYYGWDIEKRTCTHMSRAKCYNNNNP